MEARNVTTDDMRQIAAKLEADNPLWIVLYGAYSRQFVAFPRFKVPPRTFLTALYPSSLPGRMREVEARVTRYSSPARLDR
jgi:hypothetical protein